MAFIGTLRSKMGTWVVVFVFVAITAFILGDIFSGKSNILNWGRNSVGEIGGKEVSYEEYQAVIREREANWFLNTGREPGERDMPSIRQQAWDLLIARHAIQPQIENTGVKVTEDEVWDMIQGKNVDQGVKQAFTNQQTGQFEADKVVSYLNQIKTMPETSEPRIRWELFQRDLKPGRERIKYENLLIKSTYVTKAEAEREYHLATDVAEVKYLYVPYYAISDSTAKVTDADYEAYYNKNKEKFKTDATRDIKYVSIPVIASADDSAAVNEDLKRAVDEFKNSTEDSVYASANSDGQNAYAKYTPATLPAFLSEGDLVEGNVIGPVLDGDTYKVVKVSKIFNDTTHSARAKHILIKWADDSEASKKEAKEKARNILKDIKGGASFEAKAREFGTDGTASRGGDLGWFSSGQMVKPFQDAVFNASKAGVLNDVVETDFGYHIIEVTNPKTNKAYNLAIVEHQIVPSDVTTNEAFRKAETFAADISDVKEFEAKAQKSGLTVQEAKNVSAGDRRIGTLGEARQIVMWLFRDASVGKLSQVYDLQDQNVVAIMTGEVKKGYKPLEQVKEEITPAVRNEVKSKLITEKLNTLKGTLEEIAAGFGNDANVYTSSDLKLNSNSLPTVGFDPQAVGVGFSLENGKRSKPVSGDNGVVIVELQNKTIAPALTDYSQYKTQLEQNNQNRSSFSIAEAIKDKSDIEDKRYKFF
ncbi:peptidylprolyl isomerase [Ohtaekwangia koreensis]|uniref:Periplasmic chaperone PpiD n=1 Tax=Ohtaekwangia koreensis TaxID=688867 RepID=A0A1T5II27_9BACT|nr:peptidylprolyl isomerase [Ohtaekwangia koreensis]SKC38708.1 peptidyl-prolyl cis-trans isomerase D [Ohtaekwangia koreensis]